MPSKLFVGNLPDNVDSQKLKQIFQPFCKVTECDIVKNYAFVHIEEEDVDPVISRLQGYSIDGRIVNIKKSTSKLRPTPGMPNRCYRCQSDEHRTPQCPQDPNNQKSGNGGGGVNIGGGGGVQTIKIDLTGSGSGLKRAGEPLVHHESAKRISAVFPQAPSVMEAEIPQPVDPDLQQLYQEYQLSRQRYVYYRDRLLKEMEAKNHGSTAGYSLSTATQHHHHQQSQQIAQTIVHSSSATQLSAAPVNYQPPVINVSAVAAAAAATVVPQAAAPYAQAAQQASSLRAPYAAPSAPYAQAQQAPTYGLVPPAPVQPPVVTAGQVMTTQQYLQQQQQSVPHATSAPQPVPAPPAVLLKWT